MTNSEKHFTCKKGHVHLLKEHYLFAMEDEIDDLLEEFNGQLFPLTVFGELDSNINLDLER
jgi:hypothetical protein